MLAQFGIAFCTLFDELNPLMQDLPDDAAEPMGDGPNGRLIAQSRQQSPEHRLETTAFLPGGSGDAEDANQVAAPNESRTPNWHRAKIACGWKGGDRGGLAERKKCKKLRKEQKKNS